MKEYNVGSYYSALENLSKALSTVDKKSKDYRQALLLSAKIYLSIGQKTGMKQYLWNSAYFLNWYIAFGGEANKDYYYTKGLVYERLGFYERALTNYKIALFLNDSSNLTNKIILGIMRTSILLGNIDNITKYIIYLAPLESKESKELSFIMGMRAFYLKDYKTAFEYFKDTIANFEDYLLDNPEFYYTVAETAYRLKNYNLAKSIFRKIISYVKNDDVIRKSYLRLGDIASIENDKMEAFQNYLIVINRFPETQENTVARLKMLALGLKYPELENKIKSIKQLEDPIRFVVRTLISNRTNYIGKYALGNFGVLVFQNPTDFLFNRLSYELSLIYPANFTYEQAEYIANLWTKYLLKLSPDKLRMLYLSNPKFFKDIFDRDVLDKILTSLSDEKDLKQKIDLLKFMADKYQEDKYYIDLAKAFISDKKYNYALNTLEKVKNKNCDYYIFTTVAKSNMKIDYKEELNSIQNKCDIENLPFYIAFDYYYSTNNYEKLTELIDKNKTQFVEMYEKNEIFNNKINSLIENLFKMKRYNEVASILDKIDFKKLKKENICKFASMSIISKIKTKKTENIELYYNYLAGCNDELSIIAKEMYESYKILQEVGK
ncbi:hypothetical protein [Sulfurihydrogenibium sp.]|uniref:tetratricopeptide repeat protein n=1 Tax=Sulfurihydrogenibium sp. TaxID=2053621 RepID=UPI002611FAAA|nr:hypothetical protein [Sulfurihydrogenibium sp.]